MAKAVSLVHRVPGHEGFVDVDLPEAEALREVPVRPVLGGPGVGEGDEALAQVVVRVDDAVVPVVHRVHHRRRHADSVLDELADGVHERPRLRVVGGGQHRPRRAHDQHRLLGVVAGGEDRALAGFAEIVRPRVRERLAAARLRAQLRLLVEAELAEQQVLGEALVCSLHVHHRKDADRVEGEDAGHRAEPTVGDQHPARRDPRLHHAKRQRHAAPRPASSEQPLLLGALLLLLHGLFALRVELETLGRRLALDVHEAGHALPQPFEHAFIEAHDPAAHDGSAEGITQRIPKAAGPVERVVRFAVRRQLKARVHLIEPPDAAVSRRAPDLEPRLQVECGAESVLRCIVKVLLHAARLVKSERVEAATDVLQHVVGSDAPVFVVALALYLKLVLAVGLHQFRQRADEDHGQKEDGPLEQRLRLVLGQVEARAILRLHLACRALRELAPVADAPARRLVGCSGRLWHLGLVAVIVLLRELQVVVGVRILLQRWRTVILRRLILVGVLLFLLGVLLLLLGLFFGLVLIGRAVVCSSSSSSLGRQGTRRHTATTTSSNLLRNGVNETAETLASLVLRARGRGGRRGLFLALG
eukprot:7387258-Prymnesium_polylepis.2